MTKALLKSTSNTKMQQYVGMEGMLEKRDDGQFHFHFVDGSGQRCDLHSTVVKQLGDVEHPASLEVFFETKNSTYLFEKREKVRERLYDGLI